MNCKTEKNYHVSAEFGCQILYFTTCSCLNQDRGIVWIGQDGDQPNIYWTDFETGEYHQISDNHEGSLKSYVYFNGHEHRGLGKASVSFDNIHEKVYYLQGRDICCADLNGNIRVLNQIPEDQISAFTHISRDGKRFCVPTTDKRALDMPYQEGQPDDVWGGERYDIDERVRKENLNSYLRVYDTETGEMILCEKVPRCWITHVSFCPTNPEMIMYNNEWPEHCGLRRIWLWNGSYHTAVRSITEGRSINDWVCHEMWSDDGKYIIYHGGFAEGEKFLGRYSLEDHSIIEVPFDRHYTGYGHFNNSKNGLLVCDGYYEKPDYDPKYNGRWISFQKVDWEKKTITWYPQEIHDSNMEHQDNHPHPTFNPEGTRAYYTSTRSGKREIYCCPVPDELL